MQSNSTMIRKYIVLISLGLLVIIGIVGFYLYQRSFQTLTLTVNDGITAQIYPRYSGDGADDTSYKKDTLVKSVDKTSNIRLKKGIYVIHTDTTGDYKETNTVVELDDKKEITIYPPYTEKKLTSLLTSEQDDIKKTIVEKYPNIESLYTINTGELFNRGEWYGTHLTYKNSDDLYQSDTLRLLLKKEGEKWKVTTEPEIVISKIVYSEIPSKVIDSVNDLGE